MLFVYPVHFFCIKYYRKKKLYIFILSRLCIFPFPPLFSLTISKKQFQKKKTAGTSHKKVFQGKTSACRDGTLKNQPNKMGMTPQHIHTIPTSCDILPTMHPKKTFCMHLAYSHPLNEHGTQHCSLHSFPHKTQSISAMFSSTKILQRNLKLPTYHTDPVLLTVSAYKTELYLPCPVATTLQPPTM